MKTIKKLIFIAVAILSIISCKKEVKPIKVKSDLILLNDTDIVFRNINGDEAIEQSIEDTIKPLEDYFSNAILTDSIIYSRGDTLTYNSAWNDYYNLSDYKTIFYNTTGDNIFETKGDSIIRSDTLEAYIVYANLDEPDKPFTSDNAIIIVSQVMINGEEVSVLTNAYDRNREIFIMYYHILYYEIKI